MIATALCPGAMFLCIGVLYDRVHSREIAAYGGVVNTMPKFAAFALLFAMANCGLPARPGFVGEWMVILGAVKANFWLGLAAASALIFGALHAVDVQARGTWGGGQRRRARTHRHQCARVPDAGAAGHRGALHGHLPFPFTDVMDVSVADLLKHVASDQTGIETRQ